MQFFYEVINQILIPYTIFINKIINKFNLILILFYKNNVVSGHIKYTGPSRHLVEFRPARHLTLPTTGRYRKPPTLSSFYIYKQLISR